MLNDLLLCTGAAAFVLLPGVILVRTIDTRAGWPYAFVIGSALSLSGAVVCGYYLLLGSLPFGAFLAAEYLILLAVLWWRRKQPKNPREQGSYYLLIVLGLVFISRSIPLFFSDLPPGIDPSFHTIIARKILITGTIPVDWRPFETIRLNYPVGSHLLVAELAHWTGVPVHVAFKCLFPIVACLSGAAVYLVALQFFRDRTTALLSCAAYSFLAVWGSLDYYAWGGLPNALVMCVLVAAIAALFQQRPWLIGPLLAAIVTIHHHGALCAFVIFGGYALFDHFFVRGTHRALRTIIISFAIAGALALVPAGRNLVSGADIGNTPALKIYEPLLPLWTGVANLGVPLVILAAIGLTLLLRRRVDETAIFLLFWVAALLSFFVSLEYLYRFVVYLVSREFYSAFAPARFLTNLAYPLAILAGIALARLATALRTGLLARVASLVIALIALASAFFPLRAQCKPIDFDRQTYEWVAAHAETDALIVSGSPWAGYFTYCETAFTPIPASEARDNEKIVFKRNELLQNVEALKNFTKISGRPVYILQPHEVQTLDGLEEVYDGKRTRVLLLR